MTLMPSSGAHTWANVWDASALSEQPGTRERALRYLLVVILVVGMWSRLAPLMQTTSAQIIKGDSREYIALAEFLMDPQHAPLSGNRYAGYPLLLVPLFTLLPFSHEAIAVGTSMTMSFAALALLWLLATRVVGSTGALVVVALAAVHPGLAHSAHRGVTEEPFLAVFLAFLLLFVRIREVEKVSWPPCLGLALLGGCMAAIRPDSAFATIPAFVVLLWRGRSGGLAASILRALPVVVVPFLVPKLLEAMMVNLGVETYDSRAGRSGLWMEFMIGRMPYGYMFYKETSMQEWFLGHHTWGELFAIGIKSSVRNLLALGEGVWGQLSLLVSILGAAIYIRGRGDWVLPLAVPLAMVPQWAVVALWPEADLARYNLRVIPLALIFLVLGSAYLADRIHARASVRESIACWLPVGVVVSLLAPAAIPLSRHSIVRPAVDILMHERMEYKPKVREVHSELTVIWRQMLLEDGENADPTLIPVLLELRERHDAYAPTHFALGAQYAQLNKIDLAIASFQRAVEITPFFAEAAQFLAELYVLKNRREDAVALLDRTMELRPHYPLLALTRGHLQMMVGDYAGARRWYTEYNRINQYQHESAFKREERVMKRKGNAERTKRMLEVRASLDPAAAGLMSILVWSHLSNGLKGLPLPEPSDWTFYHNLGACALRDGDPGAALKHWDLMTRLLPEDADSWADLGTLQAVQGRYDEARASWKRALELVPSHRTASLGLERTNAGTFDRTEPEYGRIRIILPITRQVKKL